MEIRNIQVKGYGFLQLILDEKTALIDCAMNINCDEVEEGLKEHLGERNLDYVLLTHSHFDHVGTLSHIRKLYPKVQVFASEKTAKVFQSEGARAFIKMMNESLAKVHTGNGLENYDDSGLYVDTAVKEGDKIDLGENSLRVLETKGHTDCSISFYCEREKILFASESCGVWFGRFPINLELCKGADDTLASIRKQRALFAEKLYVSHSGLYNGRPSEYLTMAEYCLIHHKNLVHGAIKEGKTDEEIYALCKKEIFDVMIENGVKMDSYDRWMVNTKAFVAYARKELGKI